jgi:hypothetical protein
MLQRDRIEVSLRRFARRFCGDLAKRCFVNERPEVRVRGRTYDER